MIQETTLRKKLRQGKKDTVTYIMITISTKYYFYLLLPFLLRDIRALKSIGKIRL